MEMSSISYFIYELVKKNQHLVRISEEYLKQFDDLKLFSWSWSDSRAIALHVTNPAFIPGTW